MTVTKPSLRITLQYNLYYPTLLGEEQLVRIIEGLDNRRAKITGLNGVGRVGLRIIENSENRRSDNRGSTVLMANI